MNKSSLMILLAAITIGIACKKKKDKNDSVWLIPKDEVLDGGPGKDGIPSIDNPQFNSVSATTTLSNNDLVVGYKVGNDARAYPHNILDWHEMVNDDVNGVKIAITYCPLTGTAIGWNRVINGTTTTFGVSGLLYNSNLIPYDRATNSNWSQLLLKSVNGDLSGTAIATYHLVETTWGTWKAMYPTSNILSTNTGFNRSYGTYPYGDFKTNNASLLFPVSNTDSRVPNKERVHTVIKNEKAKAYRFSSFSSSVSIIEDAFQGDSIVIAGSSSSNLIVSFSKKASDGTILKFSTASSPLPDIFSDNEGNTWNIFGEATAGPRLGEKLTATTSCMGYWFGFATFYPGLEIY